MPKRRSRLFVDTSDVSRVIVVKPKRKRRKGPRITRLLKDKTVAKLKYVDVVTLNAGVAGIANYTFRANGCDDPDLTSTGHQPLMWDEYVPLYDQYRVLSSTIKLTPVFDTLGSTTPGLYGVYRDADSVLSYSKGTSIIEDMRNKPAWGQYGGVHSSDRQFDRPVKTNFSLKRDTGKETQITTTKTNTTPSSPHEYYYQVWLASIGGNDPGSASFVVELEYVVEFSSPKHVTES